MEDDNGKIKTYLASHPRLLGALFMLALLLTQVGTVAAGGSGGITTG